MAYILKTEDELRQELFIEVSNFVKRFSYDNRNINEDNYFQTISEILIEAERIDQFFEDMEIASRIQ